MNPMLDLYTLYLIESIVKLQDEGEVIVNG